MLWIRISLLIAFMALTQPLFAHEEPQPGSDAPRSEQGITNSNAPAEHPGRKQLRAGKGNLNSGSAATGGPFDASNIEFLSQLTLTDMGAGGGEKGNDIWGWTDSVTGNEYALVGRSDGTAFVDVTDPYSPVYLGFLASHTGSTAWRDVKVYADHAYIVSDNNGNHGMQVFDLTELRSVASPPAIFTETAHYSGFRNGHNIVINEASGYAYAVGTNEDNGGLHFVDLSNPTSPLDVGSFDTDGYTHDAQVVIYSGPDETYMGSEIAFNSNEDTLTIVDVTDKSSPVMLSRTSYLYASYAHQGWLTEDQRYFISNDELDEKDLPIVRFTRTHLWDVADLGAPIYMGFYEATVKSIDHNLYVHNGLAYAANYTTGLRVLDLADIANANLVEVAYIDTHPTKDSLTAFDGVWSVYPFFDSGTLIIGDRDEGLISVRLVHAELEITAVDTPDPVAQGSTLTYILDVNNKGSASATNTILTNTLPTGVSYLQATPSQGGCGESAGVVTCALGTLVDGSSAAVTLTVNASTLGSMSNTVVVLADELDLDTSDNTATLETTVLADQDGDGLTDVFETSIGTNPDNVDSDYDGLVDGAGGIVPLSSLPGGVDSDADGFVDGEQDLGTDATNSDSDGDSISDGDEVSLHGIDPTVSNVGDVGPRGSIDNLVNLGDLVVLMRLVTGIIQPTPLESILGDINNDGLLNAADMLLLHQAILSDTPP